MIKNIIFDMGGVLVEYNPEKFVRSLGYEDQEEIDYIVNHIYISTTWKDMDAGRISADEGHKLLVDTIDDKYKEDAKILVYKWWKLFEPTKGMLDLIKELYDKGYSIYLLSNASDDHPMYWQQLPYKNYFKELYVSSFHKLLKPNKEIYEDFFSTIKINKEECIFIDDSIENVNAAIDFGLKSHRFISKDELSDYLKSLNII